MRWRQQTPMLYTVLDLQIRFTKHHSHDVFHQHLSEEFFTFIVMAVNTKYQVLINLMESWYAEQTRSWLSSIVKHDLLRTAWHYFYERFNRRFPICYRAFSRRSGNFFSATEFSDGKCLQYLRFTLSFHSLSLAFLHQILNRHLPKCKSWIKRSIRIFLW